jgi:hypothetical protein
MVFSPTVIIGEGSLKSVLGIGVVCLNQSYTYKVFYIYASLAIQK